jgi:hypothetical protein
LEQSREEAVFMAKLDRQRFRDMARNILRLGLPVEQAAQAAGLPPEMVRPWPPGCSTRRRALLSTLDTERKGL